MQFIASNYNKKYCIFLVFFRFIYAKAYCVEFYFIPAYSVGKKNEYFYFGLFRLALDYLIYVLGKILLAAVDIVTAVCLVLFI